MTFSDPRWLWLLVSIPVLWLLELRAGRRAEQALGQLVGGRLDRTLLSQRLPGVRRAGALLRTGALALLCVGAAGPEWGQELVRRAASGSEVVLAVDVSASMDARDVAPSRLEEAKREALAVLGALQGSKVGVVAFAGAAVPLCPLTLDRGAARLVLESLSSGTIGDPGTDLGKGLRAAARMLPARSRNEQAIVVWTDGEDLEQDAQGAIALLGGLGLRVFAVGVGTRAGDLVPVLDDEGRAIDVKRDEAGAAVRSRLDEPLLRNLARRTRGAYFSASRPGGEVTRLITSLGSVARGTRGERLVERAKARFGLFALAGVALLAADRVRRRRRTPARAGRGRALAQAASLILICGLPTPSQAQSAWARGDRAFREGRFAEAESLYARRGGKRPPPEIVLNLAAARARAGKPDESEAGFRSLVEHPGKPGQSARYDLGTLLAEKGEFEPALAELRGALERDPQDEDARFNYEWALRRMRRPKSSTSQPPPQPSPSQPDPRSQPRTQQAPQPSQPPPADEPPPRGEVRRMDRQQAERLLESLQELERRERRRQVRVMRERRGRDW